MENLLFIALVAAVGLIRLIMQAAENKKNAEAARRDSPAPAMPVQRAPAESEEERIRRFMEALGVPKGTVPPPRKVTSRPPRKILPVDPFPLPRPIEQLSPPVAAQPVETTPTMSVPDPIPMPPITVFAESPPQPTAPAIFTVQGSATPLTPAAVAAVPPSGVVAPQTTRALTGVVARLGTSQGLRDAIVLREIFGPPRSMQPFDAA